MNTVNQIEKGILEEVQKRQSARKTEKYQLAISSQKIAKLILESHEDDKDEPEMDQLISEGVATWIDWHEAEPQINTIAQMAKNNRIIK